MQVEDESARLQPFVAAWLNPNPKDLAAQYAILEDKVHPYYEHRIAA